MNNDDTKRFIKYQYLIYILANRCNQVSKLNLPPLIKTRENRRWDWTSNPVVSRGQAIVCSYVKCGKNFSEPIELTVRAKDSLETYYACPHCLSRVSVSDKSEKSLSEAPVVASRDTSKDIKENDVADCPYSLGYLKTRPRDSSIPDECLTCASIMKCMM